jgi:adenylate cyclase
MSDNLHTYLPQDRRRALARGESLPDRTNGAALLADISGFTPLTQALVRLLGPRQGAEVLTHRLESVYTALIAEVDRAGGSVIGFAGDAVTCWFDAADGRAEQRAVTCALAMQQAIVGLATIPLPDRTNATLALKTAVSSGPARRFVVGDPAIQRLDTLAGDTISRTAVAEHLAAPGELIVDSATATALQAMLLRLEWREDGETGERFAAVQAVTQTNEYAIPPVTAQPISPEQCREWLLPAVYERELSGYGAFLTELRPTVALFLRFIGIDYEQDEAGTQLDTFICQVQTIINRYEGVLLQLTIGDKGSYLYAAFGAPVAHEDDARRAVEAALELKRAADGLASLQPVQIGISRGTMRTGAYGGTTRLTYGVLGDDANLAARLMSNAAPGEILVSKRLQSATAPDFSFVAYPVIQFKGKADPVPVFAVVGRQQRRAIRLQEPNYALPMVGRQSELVAITARMDLALQGEAQVIGIVAEAGLGKSRLVAEVIRAAHQKGFVGYGGACQSDAISTPYQVWRTIWQAFFNVDPEMPLRKLMRNLEGEIEDLAPSRVAAMPLLNVVLGLTIPENDFTRLLEPKIRQSALHALLEDCLKAAAQDEPQLIVMEDVHWMDALSHDLLEQLVKASVRLPICFVLAYRPPELARLTAPRLESLPYFTRIELQALTQNEAELAVRAKLAQLYPSRDHALPAGLVAALMARSQGNPFYLEELLNYVHDRGLDPTDLDQIELPDSLYTLILSRIDQLSEREKSTLRVASIVGRLFRAEWLTGYYPELGAYPQVKESLDQLHRLDITPLDTPEPELTYLFKHIVTHEVTYESLPLATRARLHEQLARYLESVYAEALPLEALAFHYGRSDNQAKQIEYLRRAGEAAQKNFAGDAALDFYGQLLSLLPDTVLPGGNREKLDIYLQRGQVLEVMGRWDEAESDYRAALEWAGSDAGWQASAQLALGKLNSMRGELQTALNWLAQAREIRLILNDDSVGLADTLIQTGQVLYRQGNYAEARERLNEGLALARQAGDTMRVALALHNLGNVALDQGDHITAGALYEESLALWREIGHKQGIATSLSNLGLVAWRRGDYTAAQALSEEGLRLKREIGHKQGIAISLSNLGNLASSQGDLAAGRTLYEESLGLHREMGDKWYSSLLLSNLGTVAYSQGDFAVAWGLFEESLSLSREMDDKPGVSYSLDNLGSVAASQGDFGAARALCEEGLNLRREMDDKQGISYSLDNLGSVATCLGDFGVARALFEEGLNLKREMDDKQGVARTLANLGLMAMEQGDYAAARQWLEESLTPIRETGDKYNIPRSLAYLGYLNLLQGDSSAAQSLFSESLAFNQEIGLKPGIVGNLIGLAALAGEMGDNGRSAHLAAAAETLRASMGLVLLQLQRSVYEKVVAATRAASGEDLFAAAWEEGARLPLAEAVALALAP